MSDTRTTPVKKILDKAKIILSDCELNNDELISLLGGVVSDLVMGYDLGFTEEEFSGHVPRQLCTCYPVIHTRPREFRIIRSK